MNELAYMLQSTIGSGLYCLEITLCHAESLVKVLGLFFSSVVLKAN